MKKVMFLIVSILSVCPVIQPAWNQTVSAQPPTYTTHEEVPAIQFLSERNKLSPEDLAQLKTIDLKNIPDFLKFADAYRQLYVALDNDYCPWRATSNDQDQELRDTITMLQHLSKHPIVKTLSPKYQNQMIAIIKERNKPTTQLPRTTSNMQTFQEAVATQPTVMRPPSMINAIRHSQSAYARVLNTSFSSSLLR